MKLSTIALALLLPCLIFDSTRVSATTIYTIPGTANIFGAGHTVAPDPGGGGGGTLPVGVALPVGAFSVSFPSVTGEIITGTNPGNTDLPDGNAGAGYDISSYDGISGLVDADRGGFLAGVFLNNSEPSDPAPARLTFSDATMGFASIAPLLNQTFFIGDGLTGTGSGNVQTFYVPTGATRLYLGILDAYGWTGLPGYYGDNGGAFTASVEIVPVPEPTACGFLALGFAVSLISRRKFGKRV